jgi:hypothetical protein
MSVDDQVSPVIMHSEPPTVTNPNIPTHGPSQPRNRSKSPVPQSARKHSSAITVKLLPPGKVTELRNCIAAWIYSEMKSGVKSMTTKQQHDEMFLRFHGFPHPSAGTSGRTDPVSYQANSSPSPSKRGSTELIAAYDQFLCGKNCYSAFWEPEDDGRANTLHLRSDITNDDYTNCIANVHITRQQLATTHKGSDVLVSGRTLHAAASGVIMAAKKILSLLPLAVNSKLIEKSG